MQTLPDASAQVRAAGYVRQSSARENRSEASPATQRTKNREKAAQCSAEWVGSYEDIGISAFSGAERPEFERLINDCRAGRVNMIIVYYVSRLSRMDPLDAIPIVTELLNLGVVLVSVTEGEFRKGNLMDLIHLIMRLDAAHNESKNKSSAIRGAKDAARALGGYVGGKPPYGFSMISSTRSGADGRPIAINLLDPDPTEAKVIRDAASHLLNPPPAARPVSRAGHRERPGTLGYFCRHLNTEGVPTRGATVGKKTAGSSWSPRTLERILRDPRIAGYATEVVYKQRPDNRKSKSVQGYRLVRDPGTGQPIMAHTAILDPETFWTLQQVLDGRPTFVRAVPTPSLLASMGVLFCECESPMKSNSNSAVAARSSYRCSRPAGRRLPGQHGSDCTISKAALDDHVARRLFSLIASASAGDDTDTLDVLAEATRLFGLASLSPESAGLRLSLQGDLRDAEAALTALYDDRQSGGYSTSIGQRRFLEQEATLGKRIDAITGQLAAVEANETPTLPVEQWLGEPGTDPIGPGSWWSSVSTAEQRAMISLFVRRVTVSKSPAGHTRPSVDTRVAIEWVRPAVED
ncbi:recombinase family protein [Krasilnikovia sp. MM14-A1259]|uniref:recombinase family protein n=1 Tax=Krasilnikovia sp. MM14-A1259 TaxID=3373539 RepID=UPI003811F83B